MSDESLVHSGASASIPAESDATPALVRAARAAYEYWCKNYNWGAGAEFYEPFEALDEHSLSFAIGQIRAALEAIREPSTAAAQAGDEADYWSSEGCNINRLNIDPTPLKRPATAIVFSAMIDHTLNEASHDETR